MKRPPLHQIPLSSVVVGPGARLITIDPGAWDKLIRDSYALGFVLLEIRDERPVRAFQRETSAN